MFNEAVGKDKWLLERRGKFTASECFKLMVKGKGDEMFGDGAMTYIEAKHIELCTDLWENPKMEFVKPILWGKRYEEPAFNFYRTATRNFDMRYFGSDDPVFLTYNKDSGGSPDGLMGQGIDIHMGLELKCPEQSKVHFRYCKFKDQYDLKDNVIEYYMQCQMLLMITQAPSWHWASFDDRVTEKRKKMKILEIYPDKSIQDKLEIRILQAAKLRDKMTEEFLNS